MMIECEVYEEKDLLVISTSTDQSVKQIVYEDESVTNTRTEKQTIDEGSIIVTQKQQFVDEVVNENVEGSCEEDWMNEFPPLLSRASANSVVEKGICTGDWVSALKSKKPHCPFGVNVNGQTLDTSTDESVASTGISFSRTNLSDVAADRVKFMKVRNKNDKFRQGCVTSNTKSRARRFGTLDGRSVGLDEKSIMLPQPQVNIHIGEKLVVKEAKEMHEADFKHGINEDEETEIMKEEKLELVQTNEAEKRAKRRHKRLRLKERKKAAALARNDSSLDQNPNLKQENATKSESWDDEILEEIQESHINVQKEDERVQSTSLEQEDELKERDIDVNVQQQQQQAETKEASTAIVRAELQAHLEAQLREKKRVKNLTRKARKKAKAARNKKLKWIWVIAFLILFTLLCLTMFYISH